MRRLTAREAMLRETQALALRQRSSLQGDSPRRESSVRSSRVEKRDAQQRLKLERQRTKKRSKSYKRSKFAMSPQNNHLQRWEILMMALLCYTAIVTPVEVGFYTPKINGAFYFNQFVTVAFATDLVLNFFTAAVHPNTGLLVYHLPYIAKRYAKTWLVIDFVSCIPFDAMYLGVGGLSFSKLGVLRTLRLLRLVKLIRVLRVNRIYKKLEVEYSLDYSLIELAKFATTAIIFAHWLACGFGLVEDLEGGEYSWTRMAEFSGVVIGPEGGDPREIIGSFRLYLAALYWSTMTISTIGYGDIVPVSSGERVYVIIAMLIGAFEYGYIVGAVSNVIATRNEKVNNFQVMMRDLNAFMHENRFPQPLRVRLREYFRYQLDGSDADVYKRLLEKMSPALRGECSMRMNTWIKNVAFFDGCPEGFVLQLSTCIVENTYPPEEILFNVGDFISTIFLIRRGIVDVSGKIKSSGKIIAEEALYTTEPMKYRARAVTYADIYTLDRALFQEALEPYPATRRYFRLCGVKKVFKDEIIAYAKAYWALKLHGLDADLSDEVSDRPAFYLQKLRIIYGEAGEGLDDPKILEAKTKAAIVIQKRFRGMLQRVMMHGILVERGVQGIFHKVLRERDPVSYSARALDVFHYRLAYSLTEVHRKLNALLDHNDVDDLPTEDHGGKPSIMSDVLAAATGQVMSANRAKRSDGAPARAPPSIARSSSQGWDTTSIDSPLQKLQARVDELTNRLVPLDRRITTSQAKQTAALAETNERLSELSAQLEALLSLTVANAESGIAEARVTARERARPRRALSPPPASDASRAL